MPKPFPKVSRDDVVRVAMNREARIEFGEQPGQTKSEPAELRELRKRNRLLEQEVEVLRRATAYLS